MKLKKRRGKTLKPKTKTNTAVDFKGILKAPVMCGTSLYQHTSAS
jgi:hypothetical protein